MIKIAHRGYCDDGSENSLSSINNALCNNFDMIELDIQIDKNNKIILFHDIYYKDHVMV